MLNLLEQILLFSSVLFLPTQLGKHFWPKFSFVFSLPIDYLSPVIYFWDLIVILLLLIRLINKGSVNKLALNILLIFLLSQIVSLLPGLILGESVGGQGFIKIEQYLISGLWGVYLASMDFNNLIKKISLPIALSILFESGLGILQFTRAGTIGFWILGERTFSILTPSIAKFNFHGLEFLRPYGTFPHPNTLAAYLVLLSPVLILKSRLNKLLISVTIFLSAITLFLTVSRIAFVAGFIEAFCLLNKKLVMVFVIIVLILSPIIFTRYASVLNFDSVSLFRREDSTEIAWNLFTLNPLTGVGLNNFIPSAAMELLVGSDRFLQPVHNIFLLLLSETGLIGFLGFLLLILYPILKLSKLHPNPQLFTLLLVWEMMIFMGMFDHYFLTQPQGLRILFLIWGLSLSAVSSKIS